MDHDVLLVSDQQIVVVDDGRQSVIREEVPVTEVLAVAMQGPPGPPGPPGGGAGATYTHVQTLPSSVWTVAHNLGRYPSITVVDNLGGELFADVRYIDSAIAQITHSVPLIGRAYCN